MRAAEARAEDRAACSSSCNAAAQHSLAHRRTASAVEASEGGGKADESEAAGDEGETEAESVERVVPSRKAHSRAINCDTAAGCCGCSSSSSAGKLSCVRTSTSEDESDSSVLRSSTNELDDRDDEAGAAEKSDADSSMGAWTGQGDTA